jgi:hypothetical protein
MLILAAAALAVGVTSWLWGELALPGRAVVRGHVGDAGAVALVYAAIGLVWRGPVAARAAVVAAIAVAVELAQRRGDPGGGAAGELLLGSHFDPWDLLAYAAGLVASVLWEQRARDRGDGRRLAQGRRAGI